MNNICYRKNEKSCQFIFSKLWSNFRAWHFCLSFSNGEESDLQMKNGLELRRRLQTWTFGKSKHKLEKEIHSIIIFLLLAYYNWYSNNAVSGSFSSVHKVFNLYVKSSSTLTLLVSCSCFFTVQTTKRFTNGAWFCF